MTPGTNLRRALGGLTSGSSPISALANIRSSWHRPRFISASERLNEDSTSADPNRAVAIPQGSDGTGGHKHGTALRVRHRIDADTK